jgi:NDP-sugar pyrophosphorylase family protein
MTSDALPRQAVILAGGQGSRLRPHTEVEGYWRAIDTAKDITEAAAELRSAAQPPP